MSAALLPAALLPAGLDPVPAKDQVGPGWTYLVIFAFIVGASVLLWFSLRKQVRRIRFPEDSEEQVTPPPPPTDRPGGPAGA